MITREREKQISKYNIKEPDEKLSKQRDKFKIDHTRTRLEKYVDEYLTINSKRENQKKLR